MAEDENKETSEETSAEESPQEEPQAEADAPQEETPAEETPAPPAEGEAAADETPAEEAPAGPGSEAEEPAADGEAQPSPDDDPSLTPSEEGDGPAADAESPEETPAEQPKAEDKKDKKDVIPGADLEPIAVEQAEENLSAEERARREAEEEERRQREAELTGESAEDEVSPAGRAPAKLDSDARFQATGKRKRSIARVTLVPGSGKIQINDRELEEFFPRPLHQTMARQPLTTTGYENNVDVRVRVHGGGIGGQAGAIRHGISRALTEVDPELRGELKRRGFLTRDARVKERRKAGLKKARKRPQFSKR
jgi:small subunit ribosomal protein S9